MGSRRFVPLLFLSLLTSAHAGEKNVNLLLEKAKALNLAAHPQWTNLLHYQNKIFGGVESQADGKTFFLAPEGKSNPEAELLATLIEFFRAPTSEELAPVKELTDAEIQAQLKKSEASFGGASESTLEEKKKEILPELPAQHPICRFPARLRFLKRELGWKGEDLPKIECFRLDSFRRRLDAKSASLVFSSFYLNNPSSTFGHSFIRINSGLWSQYGNYRNELLDTGINYAANATMANPVLYAVFGIAGLFPGSFTAIPYYYKVREYNDFESRDLWSYDLTLTDDELKMLVDHIWEEGSTYYDYYYFTENCSYHMFTLLDAAAPRLGLANRLPYYVIPSDTIRVAYKVPGLVSNVSYRPSVLSQFRHRLKNLTVAERESLDAVLDAKDPDQVNASLSKESAARVLDAFSDQIELSSPLELVRDGSDAQKLKQKILVKRASLGVRSPTLDVPPPERDAPHVGHGMRRVSLGFASEKDQGLSEVLGFKFAMHELLDPGRGYPRNMQIDFGQVRLRYRNRPAEFKNRFEFDELGLFKITALTPMSRYYSSKSIRAEFGGKKALDPDCRGDHRCFPLTLDFAPGWSIDPSGTEALTLFAFLQSRFTYSSDYQDIKFRIGLGPRLGFLAHFSDSLRLMATTEVLGRAFAEQDWVYSHEATLRYGFTREWAVDLGGKHERELSEVMTQLHFYY